MIFNYINYFCAMNLMENNKKSKMCCVEQIKKTISSVQVESTSSKRYIENSIDNLLDAGLVSQKQIQDLNNSLNQLYEMLYSEDSSIDKDCYLDIRDSFNKLIKELCVLYSSFRNSALYPIVKTNLSELHATILDLQELSIDFQMIYISIPESARFKELFKNINSL